MYGLNIRNWQPYVLNFLKYRSSRVFSATLFLSSKLFLVLASLLLSYSLDSQALSATTINTIQGTAPYLTFNDGITKAYETDGLLGITLSDGTTITQKNNNSSPATPIVLPNVNESFADISMFIPTSKSSIDLSALIGDSYNYWRDDDGDGQGTNGVSATGSLEVNITDKYDHAVERSEVLNVCNSPYKVVLRSSGSSLSTLYGSPKISLFEDRTETYYINPKASFAICYLKTDNIQNETVDSIGPADIWKSGQGFITQSTTPASYNRNFPTTGADGLYFYLDIIGSESGPLVWAPVTQGGITATMTPNKSGTNVRVTLTGPEARGQWDSDKPNPMPKPTLPQLFELEGKDSSGQTVLKYGFVLQKWFVSRGSKIDSAPATATWCTSLGYRLPQVKDLTNAGCFSGNIALCEGSVGATPPSNNNNYQRRIGAGFLSEWGSLLSYTDFRATSYLWTNDEKDSTHHFMVSTTDGMISNNSKDWNYNGICVYP
ncbi:hypothetical protein [Gilliamella sp. App2-1]|uniref:hypothetical protein n=1 Tax=Gilliamella sp. App2-1 TaxID=3120230 RepID=UPI0011473408|nr:hypothetical protein [Gilliamella apicola]